MTSPKPQPLSEAQARHAARALDLLTIVVRGLQDADCPAMALVCAAQDLLVMVTMSLLALASQQEGGSEGLAYEQAVRFTNDMLLDLREEITRWSLELPDRFREMKADLYEGETETKARAETKPFIHKMGKLRH